MPRRLPVLRLGLLVAVAVGAAAAMPSSAATASFGRGSARFVVSAAPSTLPSADLAGEPSLGISWKSGNALFMANTSTYKLRFDDRADPPSVAWSDVSSPYSLYNVDPILATDPASGVTLAGGDDGGCAVLSRTSDDGESWSATTPCTGVIDHPTVGVGPSHGGTTTVGYYCQQYPYDQCSRSLDGGATWGPATLTGCVGLFGHIKVASDGTAYVPSKSCGGRVGGFLTRDDGVTWSSYTIPGAAQPSRGFDPSVAAATDGSLYEAWGADETLHPLVATSSDSAAHWSAPVDLATTVRPPLTGTTFHTVVAGSPGRAAVAFLGTRHEHKDGVSALDDTAATWDLYVSMTFDNGRTWTTTQVTTDPVQRGAIADGGVSATDGRNLLDFMDAGVTREGRIVVGFADGCIEKTGCAGDGGTAALSTSAYATVACQAYGRGLFESYDR